MQKYKIANLILSVDGIEDTYFKNRMKAYEIDTYEKPDIAVVYECKTRIQLPEGRAIANVNQRLWMSDSEGNYIVVDLGAEGTAGQKNLTYIINGREMPPIQSHLAQIKFNSKWENAKIELIDIEPYCGVSNSVRSFSAVGEVFKYALLMHKGVQIHSSAIDYCGNAILFSAPPGTGKSTHTGLWKKYYPETVILNDDMPAIRILNEKHIVFGAPWSGKTDINQNKSALLKAIVFLEQSKTNYIKEINGTEAIGRLLNEVRKPVFEELMLLILDRIHDIINSVPIYLLGCDISKEAVDLVKDTVL